MPKDKVHLFQKYIAINVLLILSDIQALARYDGRWYPKSSFLDSLGIVFAIIVGIPLAIIFVFGWITDSSKDKDNTTGCLALFYLIVIVVILIKACT